MAARQELWCFGRVHTIRSSLPQRGSSSAPISRLFPQSLSSKLVRKFLVEFSRNDNLCPDGIPSRSQSLNESAASRVMRRRELMELCFISGFFTPDVLRGNEAVASEERGMKVELPEVGLENGRLRSCEGSAPCVSTSSFRSPSRFMPPCTLTVLWAIEGRQYLGSQDNAYRELLKALKRMGAEIMKTEEGRYVYATVSTLSSKDDIDDLEFLFVRKVVCFRSLSRKAALDPPFCWWPGCINGPANRGRMEALRNDLGWIPLETDEDKVWTPIFLH